MAWSRRLAMVGDAALFDVGNGDGEAATRLFPNQGFWPAARAVARSHERAIQYLEQAPVLILAAAADTKAERASTFYMRHKLGPLCERGAPLKEVMRAFGLAPPLRRVKAWALCPMVREAVLAMSALDPAMLGRVIPEKPGAQRAWLWAVTSWRGRLNRRGRDPAERYAWAVEAIALSGVTRNQVGDVADFATQPGVHFNEAWGWARASEEAHLWAARLSLDKMLHGSPIERETIIDHEPHPDFDRHDGYTFTALRTPLALFEEGAAMRHCVATYVADVVAGRCHIVSVTRAGKRIATLELDRSWVVRQIKGKANSNPGGDVLTAAGHYAFAVRKAAPPAVAS